MGKESAQEWAAKNYATVPSREGVIVLPIRCVLARVVVAPRGSISRAVFVPVRVASASAAVATAAAVSTAVRHGCEVVTEVKEMKLRSECLYAAARE